MSILFPRSVETVSLCTLYNFPVIKYPCKLIFQNYDFENVLHNTKRAFAFY